MRVYARIYYFMAFYPKINITLPASGRALREVSGEQVGIP